MRMQDMYMYTTAHRTRTEHKGAFNSIVLRQSNAILLGLPGRRGASLRRKNLSWSLNGKQRFQNDAWPRTFSQGLELARFGKWGVE